MDTDFDISLDFDGIIDILNIVVNIEYNIYNDGIGGYECGGAPGWDAGDDNIEIDGFDIKSAIWYLSQRKVKNPNDNKRLRDLISNKLKEPEIKEEFEEIAWKNSKS